MHNQTQAILLLTAHFGKPTRDTPRPLTLTEWGRFARWLRENGSAPEALLAEDPARVLADWHDRTITVERVQYLLQRAGALGLALEKWERAGLWVLTRADPEYPARLKQRLRAESPPAFFGCGNRSLLNQDGIAVVGSRDATEHDLAFTAQLGRTAARQGLAIISGSARGVDEAAMVGALEHEGTAIGVVADNLLRAATSARYRPGLMRNDLVLVSPFNPEAGFDVGNAMARNKYVYCLANAAIVVATSKGKGGTWNGAVENLKNGWVPLWVKPHPDQKSGSHALVAQGARWLPEGPSDLVSLSAIPAGQSADAANGTLFDGPFSSSQGEEESTEKAVAESSPESQSSDEAVTEARSTLVLDEMSLYTFFLRRLERLTTERSMTPEQLLERLDIHKVQLTTWLATAVEEGRLRKLHKPVRYEWVAAPTRQESLFGAQGRAGTLPDPAA